MGLKITHLDDTNVQGTLDNFLPFTITRDGETLKIRIAAWLHEMKVDAMDGAAAMRHATYAAIARFREDQIRGAV